MPLQDSRQSLTLANPMKIFISREGQKLGPYSVEEINARLRAGELNLHDWAWPEGASDWGPLESIVGIVSTAPVEMQPTTPRVVPAAPVAMKSQIVPSVVPDVTKPQTSSTPSANPSVAKPASRFNRNPILWMLGIFLLIVVIAALRKDDKPPIGPVMVSLGFCFAVFYLLRHQIRGVKETYRKLGDNHQKEMATMSERMRARVKQQMQRLVSDGAPYIEGQIVRLVGVIGLAKGACAIRFESSHASIILAHGKALTLPYGDIQLLQIGGKGHISESVNAGFIGGGLGIGGALKGAAEASLLNAAVSALTQKERVECELLMKWTTGELLMLNHEHTEMQRISGPTIV